MLDGAGELNWLLLHASLGRTCSDQVQAISDPLGNLSWVLVGLVTNGLPGRELLRREQA